MNKEELSKEIIKKFTNVMEELIVKLKLETHGDVLRYILPNCNNKAYIKKLMMDLRHVYMLLGKDLNELSEIENEVKNISKNEFVDSLEITKMILNKIAELNGKKEFMHKIWLQSSYLKEKEPVKINFEINKLEVEECLKNS